MCSSRKYPIHTLPTEGIEISRVGGGGGSLRPKQLKKCIKFNWNFPMVGKGGGVLEKNPFCGGGMDIFWNYPI